MRPLWIEFWTFIPLFLFFNTFNWCTKMPLHGKQRVWFWRFKQIKMPLCGKQGLILTDVGFCRKQLLYFLDSSVFVSLQNVFDWGAPDQSCVIWVILGSHTHQPGSLFCSPVKCVTLLEEEYHVVTHSFWKK